jgi:type I restriction enzyme S subunit
MSELPEGWEVAKLPDVCELNPGKRNGSHVTGETQVTFVPMAAVDADLGQITKSIVRPYAEVARGFTAFQENDVIMAKITPCMENGKAAIARGLNNGIGFGSTEFHVFRNSKAILPEYLFYFIRQDSFRKSAEATMTGSVGQKRVPVDFLKDTILPIAPLNEQRRIVAKLEELLGRVDTVQARLTTMPHILKRFRQSVLAAACSGRLTADWREDNVILESAGKLFGRIQRERKSYYDELCKQASLTGKRKPKNSDTNTQSRNTVGELPELPATWGYFRLDEVSHLVTDGTHKTPKYLASGKPFLSVKNVRRFLIRDADIKFISEKEHHEINSRCNPEKGDILYTKVGATFGYAAENVLTYPFSIFVSLALIKPVTPFFSSKFAELAMNSEVVFSQARERVSGIGTPDLHLVEIRDFRIPLPPLAEQQEIVRRVKALFQTADALEARYRKAKAHVDKLTPSILAKAFRGELVPQDPNDEPASVLLGRLNRETEATNGKPKRAKGGKQRKA